MKNLFFFLVGFSIIISAKSQHLPWPAESPFADSYGYTWKTNSATDGPVFDWIDITQIGTEINGLSDDNTVGPIPIGMDFTFYWVERDEIWIGDNGYISFSSGIPIASSANGFPLIPTHDDTDDILAPLMADMDAGGQNNPTKVYTWFDSLNQRFIISYHNIPFFANNAAGFAGANTFQIILNGLDSTITFQYLKQEGIWDAAYNNAPYPFIVGIENVTGNMGLMPLGIPVSDNLLPVDSTAIRFYPPKEPRILIPDAEITWVSNEDNGGSFFPWSPGKGKHLAVAQITNSGLVDIDTPIYVAAHYKNPANGLLLHADTLPVAFLNQKESRYLVFKSAFKPNNAGNYSLDIFITNPEDYSDLNAFNDRGQVEIVALDTTSDTTTMSYAMMLPQVNLFQAGFVGTGVYYEPHGYPVDVVALEYFVQPTQTPISGFRIQLFKSDTIQQIVPGQILYQKDIQPAEVPVGGGWVRVDMPIPFRIDSLGFYVAYISLGNNTVLVTEETPPISQRSYDILGTDWVVSRSNNIREPLIRAIVTINEAIATVDIEDELEENIDLQIFPNPSNGKLNIRLNHAQPQKLMIRVINMQGQKVFLTASEFLNGKEKSYDLHYLPAGHYTIQILSLEKKFAKKWLKLD